MKRPPKDEIITTAETCPPNKRARYTPETTTTPETNQLLSIAVCLNAALECLGKAQEITEFSTLGMQTQISELHKQVASSLNTSSLLKKYQFDINELSQKVQYTHNYLMSSLENTKSNLADIYFTIPYNEHIRAILPQAMHSSPFPTARTKKPEKAVSAPIRAQDVYTAIVVPHVQTLSHDNEIEILEAP